MTGHRADIPEPLLSAYVEGALTPDGVAQLQSWLAASKEHRAEFVRYIAVHAAFYYTFGDAAHSPAAAQRRGVERVSVPAIVRRFAIAAAIVVSVVAGLSLLLTYSAHHAARSAEPIATLIDTHHAVFEHSDISTKVGDQLHGGFLRLKSGDAEVEFFSGARLKIVGPAEVGLNSPMHAFLRIGKVTASVPPRAHGFTVGAPGVAIVDLGTRFELTVDRAGQSDLRVLNGKVELFNTDEAGHRSQRRLLTENQMAHVVGGAIRIADDPGFSADAPPAPRIEGQAVYLPQMPGGDDAAPLHRDGLQVILERRGFLITAGAPLWTSPAIPGRLDLAASPAYRAMHNDTRVDVYLIRFANTGPNRAHAAATIRFASPIVGILYDEKGMSRFTNRLHARGPAYAPRLMQSYDPGEDRITLDADRHAISIDATGEGTGSDNLRVFIASTPNTTGTAPPGKTRRQPPR